MKLIMLCGVIGSGKDYFAQEYIENHPEEDVEIIRFAQPLRNICAKLCGFDANNEVAYEKFKAKNRQFMVDLGESMKAELAQELFANAVYARVLREYFRTDHTVIIPDFRCKVEFDFLPTCFNTKIVFCNYKADRYEINPEQETEKMAIYLLEKGCQDRQEFTPAEFEEILQDF